MPSHFSSTRANNRFESLVERRKHTRYSLRIPVLFAWPSGQEQCAKDGCTENISTHGICVSCVPDSCPPLGTRLNITLVLPTAEGRTPGTTLKGEGKIVRRETPQGKLASFAAETYFRIDLH